MSNLSIYRFNRWDKKYGSSYIATRITHSQALGSPCRSIICLALSLSARVIGNNNRLLMHSLLIQMMNAKYQRISSPFSMQVTVLDELAYIFQPEHLTPIHCTFSTVNPV